MRDALSNFATRQGEVELYFRFLKATHLAEARIAFTHAGGRRELPLGSDIRTMLRANAYLILYNLVESTVMDGVTAVCSSVKAEGLTYTQVRTELRKLWLSAKYSGLEQAGRGRHVERARELVEHVLNGCAVDLVAPRRISGNLDARSIRALADDYGFSADTDARTRGGSDLLTVKDRRNGLAHGSLSFIECGRDSTIRDLISTKRQVILYLAQILENIGVYISAREYAAP